MERFPSLTPAQIKEASARLKGAGLALPRHGWSIVVPAGPDAPACRLARDPKGYYWVR
jgi:hypothetical protein